MTTGLEGRRFLYVTGKGGVGKTTVTAALALVMASRGKRVLCAMCQAKERLSTLLEGPPVGDDIVQLRPNIHAVNIQPEVALAEYGQMTLKIRPVYKAVFENRLVKSFLRATPGLYQWAMLGKAWFHTTETLKDGSPRFDVVIVDAPSTGHGLDMLRGPKVIVDLAPSGLLRREAEKAWALFSDPVLSGVVLVTLPEEMPVTETLDLLEAMRTELHLPVVKVVVNGVLPPLFSAQERDSLLSPRELDPKQLGDAALAVGARRARRELVQHDALVRLRESVDVPMAYLPHVFADVDSLKAISDLATRIQ